VLFKKITSSLKYNKSLENRSGHNLPNRISSNISGIKEVFAKQKFV